MTWEGMINKLQDFFSIGH